MSVNRFVINILTICLLTLVGVSGSAQVKRSAKSTIRGGVLVPASERDELTDSLAMAAVLFRDSLAVDSLKDLVQEFMGVDSLAVDSLARVAQGRMNELSILNAEGGAELRGDAPLRGEHGGAPRGGNERGGGERGGGDNSPESSPQKEKLMKRVFSDSVSLSTMAWTAAILPGYGQIYNKQSYKLPIVYGALGLSLGMFIYENKKYQPLKREYDQLTYTDLSRSEYLDNLQAKMIRSNTRRQFYIGGMAASYIYSLVDATVKYSSNEVSSVKKATTLSMVCPGAGQVYNKSYWKLPFVVGGFATMIYVIDWNSRGYVRFKKAYALRYDFDENPDNYDGVSLDEFGGRYSASYLKSIRNSYRRNRDLCLIMTAGLYILQVIDAHVDAHLRDYDISDDLTMNIEPVLQSGYSPAKRSDFYTYGFNVNVTF